MTTNLSSGLVGLSLLSGTNSLATYASAATAIETRAVRVAKAQFTTPATTPPWKSTTTTASTSASLQLSAIKAMATIIDPAATGTAKLPDDVQTSFTTYKALDRLKQLAQAAADTTTSSSMRAAMEKTFAKGLTDLQGYLATAPSNTLKLSFAQPAARAQSVAVLSPSVLTNAASTGKGVVADRAAALPGLEGNERFVVALAKAGASDTVTVDLAGTPQPPTLDSVAAAINAAIAAIPRRGADGAIVRDDTGAAVPKWHTSFDATKQGSLWGLTVERQGTETVSIDQEDASDTLMVAAGVSDPASAVGTRIMRFDDPADSMARRSLGVLTAIDSAATTRAALLASAATPAKASTDTSTATATTPTDVLADTSASAIATDAHGFSYVVGTTNGKIAANLSDGTDDLLLTKLDSEGQVMWQRSLGAAQKAQGAAVTIAPDGGVVVAGTVSGAFDGATTDGDMLVARYDANGDESFTTLVRSAGADSASAVAVGADGSIIVAGRSAGGASVGGGDAFLARIDATGHLKERRVLDSGGDDAVTALSIAPDGALLALTREGANAKLRRMDVTQLSTDLGELSLGAVDARTMAVRGDGMIAVGGASSSDSGRDGFVARIDAALTGANMTIIATPADDQVDSVAFLADGLFAGGRTTGALAATRSGKVDGFVSRIDAETGALEVSRQFGQPALSVQPVRLSAVAGGDTALGALGLHRGTLTRQDSAKLVAQTSLRAGDAFSIKVNDGAVRKITITDDDTLTTLVDRIRSVTGAKATVTAVAGGDVTSAGDIALRIDAKPGNAIALIPGTDGSDALAKLGLAAERVSAASPVAANAPRVRPGGNFGLDLTQALNIGTAKDAAIALSRLTSAISVTQTGYRSLYWDDTKASIVNGGVSSSSSSSTAAAAYNAQTAKYQAALDRLTSGSTASTITTSTTTASLLGY